MRRLVTLTTVLTLGVTSPLSAQAVPALGASAGEPAPGVAPLWVKGTPVQLMVVREINSRTARAGDRFSLRVNEAVTIEGRVAIPVGATATGEVISVHATSAAGGKGRVSVRLISVETAWGPIGLSGTRGTEGDSNTGGVIMGVLGFGILGLLNKGGNASLKGGDLITGFIE